MHRTSPPSLDPADHHASYMTLDGRISMAGVSHASLRRAVSVQPSRLFLFAPVLQGAIPRGGDG
ncbi:hypothetical protein MNEG_3069 [Monoraphidium neglectum]|uniref:Uncharacterized protein n=1 Tax=Monoraphidium neglectum TaxID=145388 RepID=A0A0D2NIZ4_9CHLO|nr:hypothetical protein MNEG_3069 [Monoraphidium neglectum]KIZ04886.1 hypothetical protein MNEG_3069 [Monoraphidium neglectum]|eukprot:XP_013903905.1 hypothetical protein MNEG_3069 [Monoraphidium neglectum]